MAESIYGKVGMGGGFYAIASPNGTDSVAVAWPMSDCCAIHREIYTLASWKSFMAGESEGLYEFAPITEWCEGMNPYDGSF